MSTIKKTSIQTPLILSAIIATSTLPPAQATTVTELDDAIDLIKTLDPENETCSVDKVVFARGIQSYKSDGSNWVATGPLADLYDTDYLTTQAEEIEIGADKIGTHYQHLAKPAWEFFEGRVIVESASAMPSPNGPDNVAWLNVKLVDGYVGIAKGPHRHVLMYDRLYRVLTDRGVAPSDSGSENDTIGSGYTTYYVFLDCVED